MRLGVFAMAISLAGCTLTFLTSLDDASDGPLRSPDGGTDAETTSVGPGDAGPGAALEAGSATKPGTFCATQPGVRLCDDFDDETRPLEMIWPDSDLQNGASLATSTAQVRSAPQSALVSTNAVSGTGQPSANRGRIFTFSEKKSTITYAISLYIDQVATNAAGFAIFNQLFVDAPPNKLVATRFRFEPTGPNKPFQVHAAQAVQHADGGQQFGGDIIALPLKKWFRVVRRLKLSAPPTETISIDGEDVAVNHLDDAFAPTSKVTVRLGFEYVAGPAEPYRVFMDDVVVDAQ